MQEGHPIAFFSQALKGLALLLSTYENELLPLFLLSINGDPIYWAARSK